MSLKPALAADVNLATLKFPCWGMPKIDGVRAWNPNGKLVGRSMDPFKGYGITEYFSVPQFQYLDGEMTAGAVPNSPDQLCHASTSAMGKFKDVTEMADVHWWLFDYVAQPGWEYWRRYAKLQDVLKTLQHPRLHLVPYVVVESMAQAQALIEEHLDNDYEGTIFRNHNASHKEGRPSVDGAQQLLRQKPWVDSEALVTGIEGDRNENEAKVNTLGRTERSSAKAGKVPNGMVGTLQATLLEDIGSPFTGKPLFKKGLPINISQGKMTAVQRKYYFEHPEEIVGHVVKFQHFAHGTLDLPRMAGYLSHRLAEDMSK